MPSRQINDFYKKETEKNRVSGQTCYWSDACGIALASLRIMQTLPDRIREWNLTPCQAETTNRKELEKLHKKQDAVKARLEQLNRDFRDLEDLISRGKDDFNFTLQIFLKKIMY